MNSSNKTENTVTNIISNLLNCDINIDSSRINTTEWDSLRHIEIIFALEDAFSLQFAEDELNKLDRIASIVSVIERKMNET